MPAGYRTWFLGCLLAASTFHLVSCACGNSNNNRPPVIVFNMGAGTSSISQSQILPAATAGLVAANNLQNGLSVIGTQRDRVTLKINDKQQTPLQQLQPEQPLHQHQPLPHQDSYVLIGQAALSNPKQQHQNQPNQQNQTAAFPSKQQQAQQPDQPQQPENEQPQQPQDVKETASGDITEFAQAGARQRVEALPGPPGQALEISSPPKNESNQVQLQPPDQPDFVIDDDMRRQIFDALLAAQRNQEPQTPAQPLIAEPSRASEEGKADAGSGQSPNAGPQATRESSGGPLQAEAWPHQPKGLHVQPDVWEPDQFRELYHHESKTSRQSTSSITSKSSSARGKVYGKGGKVANIDVKFGTIAKPAKFTFGQIMGQNLPFLSRDDGSKASSKSGKSKTSSSPSAKVGSFQINHRRPPSSPAAESTGPEASKPLAPYFSAKGVSSGQLAFFLNQNGGPSGNQLSLMLFQGDNSPRNIFPPIPLGSSFMLPSPKASSSDTNLSGLPVSESGALKPSIPPTTKELPGLPGYPGNFGGLAFLPYHGALMPYFAGFPEAYVQPPKIWPKPVEPPKPCSHGNLEGLGDDFNKTHAPCLTGLPWLGNLNPDVPPPCHHGNLTEDVDNSFANATASSVNGSRPIVWELKVSPALNNSSVSESKAAPESLGESLGNRMVDPIRLDNKSTSLKAALSPHRERHRPDRLTSGDKELLARLLNSLGAALPSDQPLPLSQEESEFFSDILALGQSQQSSNTLIPSLKGSRLESMLQGSENKTAAAAAMQDLYLLLNNLSEPGSQVIGPGYKSHGWGRGPPFDDIGQPSIFGQEPVFALPTAVATTATTTMTTTTPTTTTTTATTTTAPSIEPQQQSPIRDANSLFALLKSLGLDHLLQHPCVVGDKVTTPAKEKESRAGDVESPLASPLLPPQQQQQQEPTIPVEITTLPPVTETISSAAPPEITEPRLTIPAMPVVSPAGLAILEPSTDEDGDEEEEEEEDGSPGALPAPPVIGGEDLTDEARRKQPAYHHRARNRPLPDFQPSLYRLDLLRPLLEALAQQQQQKSIIASSTSAPTTTESPEVDGHKSHRISDAVGGSLAANNHSLSNIDTDIGHHSTKKPHKNKKKKHKTHSHHPQHHEHNEHHASSNHSSPIARDNPTGINPNMSTTLLIYSLDNSTNATLSGHVGPLPQMLSLLNHIIISKDRLNHHPSQHNSKGSGNNYQPPRKHKETEKEAEKVNRTLVESPKPGVTEKAKYAHKLLQLDEGVNKGFNAFGIIMPQKSSKNSTSSKKPKPPKSLKSSPAIAGGSTTQSPKYLAVQQQQQQQHPQHHIQQQLYHQLQNSGILKPSHQKQPPAAKKQSSVGEQSPPTKPGKKHKDKPKKTKKDDKHRGTKSPKPTKPGGKQVGGLDVKFRKTKTGKTKKQRGTTQPVDVHANHKGSQGVTQKPTLDANDQLLLRQQQQQQQQRLQQQRLQEQQQQLAQRQKQPQKQSGNTHFISIRGRPQAHRKVTAGESANTGGGGGGIQAGSGQFQKGNSANGGAGNSNNQDSNTPVESGGQTRRPGGKKKRPKSAEPPSMFDSTWTVQKVIMTATLKLNVSLPGGVPNDIQIKLPLPPGSGTAHQIIPPNFFSSLAAGSSNSNSNSKDQEKNSDNKDNSPQRNPR